MSDRREDILTRICARCVLEQAPEHVPDDKGPCWVWLGPTSGYGRGGGYPRMSLNGQTVAVHRVIWTHFFGYLPSKKHLDHICRVRNCVSPHHTEMTSHKENQKRMRAWWRVS